MESNSERVMYTGSIELMASVELSLITRGVRNDGIQREDGVGNYSITAYIDREYIDTV